MTIDNIQIRIGGTNPAVVSFVDAVVTKALLDAGVLISSPTDHLPSGEQLWECEKHNHDTVAANFKIS